jgi:hypothetical protein
MFIEGSLKHEGRERKRNARKAFAPFVPFRGFRDSNPLCSQFAPTLETLSLGKPAPDQFHLEAVASVGRFDQLAPGEQGVQEVGTAWVWGHF